MEASHQVLGNVETAFPLFIMCVPEPLIVKTPNYTFISPPHSCDGCSNISTDLHKNNDEYIVTELSGFSVAEKC